MKEVSSDTNLLTEYGMCDHRLAIRSSMQTRTNTDSRQQAKNKSAAYIEHWRAVKIQFTRTYAYLVNFC